jgi:hypothetical protein
MVYFQTKNPDLGTFWSVLQWQILVYFTDIWKILWTFGIFVGHFGIFSRFGMLYQEKSGNPGVYSNIFSDRYR